MSEREDREIAIYCPAHRGVFMAKLSEIEGEEEITCKVCGAKLVFAVKDPFTNINVKMSDMLSELVDMMIKSFESQLMDFLNFFGEDWHRRRKKFR